MIQMMEIGGKRRGKEQSPAAQSKAKKSEENKRKSVCGKERLVKVVDEKRKSER